MSSVMSVILRKTKQKKSIDGKEEKGKFKEGRASTVECELEEEREWWRVFSFLLTNFLFLWWGLFLAPVELGFYDTWISFSEM